jgi:acetyl-CoA carboxylase biotin carboxyl carrier protein
MDLAKIKKLLAIVAESDVAEVEIEEEGLKVVVRKSAPTVMMQQPPAYPPYPLGFFAPPVAPATAVPANSTHESGHTEPAAPPAVSAKEAPAPGAAPAVEGEVIRAPIVGTFYRSPSPDSDAFVNVGDRVQPGDVLCIIEAMKLMNEIECETSGVVRRILVENAEPVEYDQPLFVIETE